MTTSILAPKPISFQTFYEMWHNEENTVTIQIWMGDIDVTVGKRTDDGSVYALKASRKIRQYHRDTDSYIINNLEQLLGEINEELMEKSISKPRPNFLPHIKD